MKYCQSLKLVEALEHMYKVVGELYKIGMKPEVLLKDVLRGISVKKEATTLSRAIAASYQLHQLTYTLKDLVMEAQKFAITKRVYSYEEAYEIRGVVLWSHTIKRMATLQPPLQLVLVKIFNTPEYVLLRYTITIVKGLLEYYNEIFKSEVEKLLEILRMQIGLKRVIFEGFDKCIKKLISNINTSISLLKRLEKKTILSQVVIARLPTKTSPQQLLDVYKRRRRELVNLIVKKPWKPKWVQKLLQITEQVEKLENELEKLRDIISHTSSMKSREARKIASASLRLLSWRLYELYVLYALLQAIAKLKYIRHVKLDEEKHQLYITFSNGKRLIVLYNQPLENSILAQAKAEWIRNGRVTSKIIQKMRGKPDIAIKTNSNTRLIILEAKFSNNPAYLSAAKFKILAYIYEYQAQVAILAYPAPPIKSSLDSEETEVAGILIEAYRKNGMKIEFRHTTLYILPIVPHKNKFHENIQILQKVLSNHL